jgi:hypothetical protein
VVAAIGCTGMTVARGKPAIGRGCFPAETRGLALLWRKVGSTLLRRGRQALPFVISAGLVAWLVWMVHPRRLAAAFQATNWPALVALTAVQAAGLFLYDSVCLWWLFSQPDRRLSWRQVLRLRSDTVIWSALNLEVGQAAFAWKLTKMAGIPLASTLGYCALLALVDTFTVQSLALAGSFLYSNPRTRTLRWICVGIMSGLVLLAVVLNLLPERWWRWLAAKSWANWLEWISPWALARLWLLRLILFALVLVYVGACLAVCRVPVSPRIVLGTIPFVFMAEALPGTAGLGEREGALLYLYPGAEDQRAVLLSFGLIWSAVVILMRVTISLASWSLPRRTPAALEPQSAPSAPPSPPAASPE